MKRKILFLVVVVLLVALLCACGHTHEFGAWVVAKEPTCAEEGATERSCECGEKEIAPIPVLKHNYSKETIVKDPTCTEEGEKKITCSECGDSYTEKITTVGEHKYSSKVTTEATCVATGVKTFTCSGCGDSYTDTIAATGHDYYSMITAEETCTKEGEKTFTCSYCGDSYTEVIEKASHSWKNATCTTAKTCSVCGETEGTALGHQVSNGKCSRCGEKITAVLYEDAKIKITFHSVEKGYKEGRAEVYLLVENKTAKTLLIQADALSLNGYCFSSPIMSDTVNAYSIGKINASIDNFDPDLVDLDNITTIGAQLIVRNDADWSDKFVAVFSNIKIDGTGKGTKPQDFNNRNLLYSDKNISIYYKSAELGYNADRAELYLFVENKTSKVFLVQCDAVSLNKFSYSNVIISDYVLPGTIGIINVSVNKVDFSMVDINNITSLGGQFVVRNDANWSDKFVAKFTNVPIQ